MAFSRRRYCAWNSCPLDVTVKQTASPIQPIGMGRQLDPTGIAQELLTTWSLMKFVRVGPGIGVPPVITTMVPGVT